MQTAMRIAHDRWYQFDPDRSLDFGTHTIWQAPLQKTKFSSISVEETRFRVELAGELWLMNFDIETAMSLAIYCTQSLELFTFSRQRLAVPAVRSCIDCEVPDLKLWEELSSIVYYKQVDIVRTDHVG